MGKKISNGKMATGNIKESQVTSQLHVSHGRSLGMQKGALSFPVAKAKSVIVLMVTRWLPVACRAVYFLVDI